MTQKASPRISAATVKDMAVAIVTRRGAVERSGEANLAVFRQGDIMIAYTTPFNRAQRLSAKEKYQLALEEGDPLSLLPYAVEIWFAGLGRVFTAGWGMGTELHVPRFKQGDWLAALQDCHEQACEPRLGEPGRLGRTALRRLEHLERENVRLRRTLSELVDTMSAASGVTG